MGTTPRPHVVSTRTVQVGDVLNRYNPSPVARVERERICDHRGNYMRAVVWFEDGTSHTMTPGYFYPQG